MFNYADMLTNKNKTKELTAYLLQKAYEQRKKVKIIIKIQFYYRLKILLKKTKSIKLVLNNKIISFQNILDKQYILSGAYNFMDSEQYKKYNMYRCFFIKHIF